MDDLQQVIEKERFHHDSIAADYDQWFVEPLQYRLLNREIYDQIVATLKCKGEIILEIGAGTGAIAIPLAESGYNVMAMDISIEMLDNFRRKNNMTPVFQANALQLPIQTGSVKSVIVSETLHHLPEKHKFLDEIRRVLAKDGIIFIFEPQKLPSGLDWIRRMVRLIFCPGVHVEDEEPIEPKELVNVIKNSGFHIVSIKTTFFFPFSSKSPTIQKVIERVWNWPSKIPLINRFGGVVKIVARKNTNGYPVPVLRG